MFYALALSAIVFGVGLEGREIPAVCPSIGFQNEIVVASVESKYEDDAKLIRSLIQQQQTAWNAGDLEKFMQPYWKSPKLTFSSGGQTTRGWQATLDRYKKKYSSRALMGQLEFSNLEIDLLSEQSALVLGQWQLVRAKDQPHGNFTLVLRRFVDGWKIVHDHSSLFDEPESETSDQHPST